MILLEFVVAERRYALPLDVVDRTYQAVEVTPVPDAPSVVKGVVNIQGVILPVVSLRRRMKQEDREVALTDRLVVVDTPRRKLALLVDAVPGVVTVGDECFVEAEDIYPDMGLVKGITTVDGDLLVVENLECLFLWDDEETLAGREETANHAD